MTYDAGVARAAYILSIDQPRQAAAELRQLFQGIQQQAAGLGQGGATGLRTVTAEEVKLAQALAKTADAEARRVQATGRKAEVDARAARTIAQTDLVEQRHATEIARTAKAQDQAAISALRRADAEKRAAQAGGGPALPRTFAGFTPGGLNQAAGAFGLATLGPQIVGQSIAAGIEAGKSALALRETQNGLRAVAGDLKTYNQTIQAARDQQRLFGGTLQENIEGLSGLTITARSSGASLQSLIDLSQRLAVLDPAQGAQGARIALNEALSGDPTSLAKRYEIPRAALAKLRDTTLPVEERLKVIDSFLSKVGITSESVAGRVDQTALAYRGLNAELDAFKTGAGSGLASFFERSAVGLGRIVGLINQNPRAIAELKALAGGKGQVTDEDVAKVTREQQQRAGDAAINRGSEGLLRAETFGTNAEGNAASQQGIETFERLRAAMADVQSGSDAAKASAEELIRQYTFAGLPVQSLTAGLEALASQSRGEVDIEDRRAVALAKLNTAQDEALAKTQAASAEIQKSAQASTLDAAQKDVQAAANQRVALETKNAADAFLRLNPNLDASQAFALAAAQGLDPLVAQVIALRIEADKTRGALLGQLNLANQVATNQNIAANRAFRPSGREGGSDRQADADAFNNTLIKQNAEQAALLDSEIALAAAKKETARQIELLRQKQAQYAKGTAEYNNIQAQIIGIEASGGKARVSSAQTTALQLQNTEQNSQLQLAKIQREGLERLRDQQEDFDIGRARSQEDEDRKIRSLLAHGQRAEAAREREEFALKQKREQEDFNRQRQRTLRNNAEQAGDAGARTDLREEQIGNRAALRGVRPGAALPANIAPLPAGAVSETPRQVGPQRVGLITIQGVLNIDGKAAGNAVFPTVEILMDESLAISLAQIGIPNAGQLAVGGAG